MSDVLEVAREDDLDALARMVSLAFAGTLAGSREWCHSNLADTRVVRKNGRAVGTMRRVPMGMHLMGRSVPCVGVAGVAVAPEWRGRGVARTVMSEALREMRQAGTPISTLYASTAALYRRVGYEQAGHHWLHTIAARSIAGGSRELPIVAVMPTDPGVRACYARTARDQHGSLDRSEYIWTRVGKWYDREYHGFAARGEDATIEGYVFLHQARRPDGRHDLLLSDLSFSTARGARSILTLLADFDSMAAEIQVCGGPMLPIAIFLPERDRTIGVTLKDYWMMRIVDVGAAVAARGYPAGLSVEVHLDLRDELLPENAGRWVVRVRDGAGSAERGGRGEVRLDVAALAPLYSGFLPAATLARLGKIEGDAEVIEKLGAAFVSPPPATADFY